MEGPYLTVSQLMKESLFYKKLKKENPSRAEKIINDRYIPKCSVNKMILVKHGEVYSEDFWSVFTHTIKGDSSSNEMNGVHLFDPQTMHLKSVTAGEDVNLVWKALVEVYNREKKKWFPKESTFFPRCWTNMQLFYELKYAYDTRIKMMNSQFKYAARTLTGVPVIIIIKDGKTKSIYPVYTDNFHNL